MKGYHIVRDARREYRWHFKASNGETISVSSEGYVNKSDCRRSIQIMQTEGGPSAPVYDDTGEQQSAAYR